MLARALRPRLCATPLAPLARSLARAHAAHEAKKRAAVDAVRRTTVQRHASLIRSAVRSGEAARLSVAVEAAKRDSVPKLVIDRALNSLIDGAAGAETVLIEASAPGGVLLVVRAVTPNRSTLMHDLRRCLNQAEIGTLTATLWAFEKEASFSVAPHELAREPLELIAIEHGADDLLELSDGALRVLCVGEDSEHRIARLSAEVVAAVSDALVPTIETNYRPSSRVSLDDEPLMHAINELVQDLSECEGVEAVFTNLDLGQDEAE